MRFRFSVLAICFVLAALRAQPTSAEVQTVGIIKKIAGSVSVVRGGESFPARVGEKLLQKDTLRTGSDGSLGVIFKDDTLLSLGRDSELRIDEFVFAPAEGRLSMVLKMMRGIATYVSGKIAKLSPDSVRIETQVATVGIRGTRLLAKVVQD